MVKKKTDVAKKKAEAPQKKKGVSRRSNTTMPSSFPDIAERFKQFKDSTGLIYQDLATELGVTKETLQAYASGRVSPNFHVLRMMKKKFGLDYDWLIDGVPAKTPRLPLSKKINEITELLKNWEGKG